MIVSLFGEKMRVNLANVTKAWIQDFVESGTVEVLGFEKTK